MGRRSQHAPEALRKLIVDAAEAIVATGGLGQLSAREIAKRIRYSPGTIYNVFENLDDVVLAVEGRLLDRLWERILAVPVLPAEDHILRLTQAYIAFTHENPRLWNLLFEHRLPEGQELPGWYLEKLQGLFAVIEKAISPHFPSSDKAGRERASRVLWSAVHGITALSTSGKLSIITTDAAPRLAEDLVRRYLSGLAAPSRPARRERKK